MTCRQIAELVERIADGELTPDAGMRFHLESCPRCASALATARRIEWLLSTQPEPPAPARFTSDVQNRIRREHWRAEQQVDRLFNAAIAVAMVLVLAAGAFLLNVQAVLAGAAVVVAFVTAASSEAVVNGAPWLGTYVAAAGLLGSAVAMWWWAERA